MIAPVPLNKHHPSNRFRVNEDPEKLDAIYNRILGDGGDKILTEEVKWLAVTHKSFDQGRRGYNDRLAFLGIV
jgi:large subunit ribosomal protein L15